MKPSNYTSAHQSITYSRRMLLVGGAQLALGGALIARLGYLAISQGEHYKLLSESNRVQLIVVPPRRGWIIDRAGKPIAINRSDFRVDIIPEQFERPTQTLALLAQLLDLPTDDVDRIIKDLRAAKGFQPVQVAENVPYDKYAAVGFWFELANELAASGQFDPLAAGGAAQLLLEGLFQTLLADLEAGGNKQRIIILSLIILGRRSTDIADQVTDGGTGRVKT
jgi:penicillin-binding protein 2